MIDAEKLWHDSAVSACVIKINAAVGICAAKEFVARHPYAEIANPGWEHRLIEDCKNVLKEGDTE